jgi:hypothetical protein
MLKTWLDLGAFSPVVPGGDLDEWGLNPLSIRERFL